MSERDDHEIVRTSAYTRHRRADRQPLGRTEDLLAKEDRRQAEEERRRAAERPPETEERPKRKHTAFWAVLLVFNILCIAAIALALSPQLLHTRIPGVPGIAFVNGEVIRYDGDAAAMVEAEHREAAALNGVIADGVTIDGVPVGGMTVDEARAAVEAVSPQGGGDFSVRVEIGGTAWVIDTSMVPVTRNTDEVLLKAYAVGRQKSRDGSVTGQGAGNAFVTSLSFDKGLIRTLTDQIAAQVNIEPVNAQVASFDPVTKAFTFTEDKPGVCVDPDALYADVMAVVNGGGHGTVRMEPEEVFASVTRSDLAGSFARISSYSTKTTNNKNRNTNIRLSAEAINGRRVEPGEIFSFNQTTGERTERKGYREAAAISGGQTQDEVGGGVCQTSSTLFNAAARADLEIVTRSPHAWPSNYVEKGFDATVNWPGLDFRFRNNTDYPIYIVAWYENRTVTVELYGKTLGDGVTIDLESKTIKTIQAPEGIKYVQNPELIPGERVTTVKARKGYVVETYQVWYRNGVEFDRKLLCTSTYKAYQQTVEYN